METRTELQYCMVDTVTDSGKKLEECVTTDDGQLNSSSDVACLRFSCCHLTKLLDAFKTIHFGKKQHNFDQIKEVYISEGSVVSFFRCSQQVHSNECQISSGFCLPKNNKNRFIFDQVIKK